jgi:hypothetical protein
MQRGKFSRKFKFEAVKLVRERGVSVCKQRAAVPNKIRWLAVHCVVKRSWTDRVYGFWLGRSAAYASRHAA